MNEMYLRNAYEETTKNFNLNYLYFQFLKYLHVIYIYLAYLKRNAVIIPGSFRVSLSSRVLVFRFLQGPTRVPVSQFLQGPARIPVFWFLQGPARVLVFQFLQGLARVPLGSRVPVFRYAVQRCTEWTPVSDKRERYIFDRR